MSDIGFQMLKLSIRMLRKMYDPEVVICYNNIKDSHLAELEYSGVTLYKQPTDSLPLAPEGVAWKLYPPRLAPDRHEMFVDNDLIIHRKMNKISAFLSNRNSVIYTNSLYAAFGSFKSMVPDGFRLNTGLFGIPPGYDFEAELLRRLRGKRKWDDYFDEQGLVASALSAFPVRIEINLKEIGICEHGDYKKCFYGYHFVGSNRTEHNAAWTTFLKERGLKTLTLL